MHKISIYITVLLLASVSPALSQTSEDPILQSLEAAAQHYREGGFTAALTDLTHASLMIHQKKGESLERLLPQPLNGWAVQQNRTPAAGSTDFEGTTTIEQRYIKNESSIMIRFSMDSPMMQSMLMMFSNPVFASSAGTLELIKGQKAIIDFQETSGNINLVIGSNILITIEGKNITRTDLLAAASMIDMDALTRLP